MTNDNLMHFRICYSGEYEDWFQVSGETMEEIRLEAYEGCQQRGWDIADCWSERM